MQKIPRDSVIGAAKEAIITRRGKEARNIAKVAAARRLLTLIYYGLRDGQIRCLTRPSDDSPPARRECRRHDRLFLASGQARGRPVLCPAAWRRGRCLD